MLMSDDIQVLVVDDDNDVLDAYQDMLEIAGFEVKTTSDPTQVVTMIDRNWPGVVVTDMYMPGLSGIDLLKQLHQQDKELPVIIITGHGDIPMAVDAVRQGATDFLEKPLQPMALITLLERFIPQRRQVIEQRKTLEFAANDTLLGDSPLIAKIRDQIANAASTRKDVLIEGETGSGRHSVAKLLHKNSDVAEGPLLEVNGSSITNAMEMQHHINQARGGSLILTNPHFMPIEIQQWLCRTLLEQERLGKKETRVLAIVEGLAEPFVEKEEFVPELFYFLSQVRFSLPTLRQRACDITPLFKHFLKLSCLKLNKPIPTVDKAYINTLNRHEWSGNVLELKNVAELYAIGIVKLAGQERSQPLEQMSSPLDDLIDGYEKQVIEDALYLFAGRINDVSAYLQIPRKKLYLRMKKHGLDKAEYKAHSAN
ncbi:sigma-54-dependent transcriptional regulator [Photobacterium damselae]|uniref:Two-component system response regulator n=2 Tax=Photobacterium damselae TaxID=38293 RepID=A0ACD3SXD5_PHODM|nr:sigma-54 dependent transcriptional regulator [Photobacterium damselae]RDL34266.1 two-component system response regulator [Photobacterium damselae]TMX63610.1 two-component system response regulator [Photobacterium damselae]TMX72871.1 two-component system response regulator [Photobacterium damselae]